MLERKTERNAKEGRKVLRVKNQRDKRTERKCKTRDSKTKRQVDIKTERKRKTRDSKTKRQADSETKRQTERQK